MFGRPGMFGGVFVRGIVAAKRHSACLARPEVHPARAYLHAVGALAVL